MHVLLSQELKHHQYIYNGIYVRNNHNDFVQHQLILGQILAVEIDLYPTAGQV